MSSSDINNNESLTFTTTQAGKICGVSQQTVIKWIDSGRLKGYQLPDSHARRVTRDSLLRFMRDNNIPADSLHRNYRTKILVVDDEEIVADMIELEFEDDDNVEIRKAERGFDAGVVLDYRPDIVILDIMLPDIDGRRVCELIRAGAGGDDIRIIGISGYSELLNTDEMLDQGFDEFISKPFTPRRIRDAVMGSAATA